MHFFYELKEEQMEIYEKESVHYPPHIHKSMECIYVTSGTLELGVGRTLCHMETGDFGIVFPNVIHHYQVFSRGGGPGLCISWLRHLLRDFIWSNSRPASPKTRCFRQRLYIRISLTPWNV